MILGFQLRRSVKWLFNGWGGPWPNPVIPPRKWPNPAIPLKNRRIPHPAKKPGNEVTFKWNRWTISLHVFIGEFSASDAFIIGLQCCNPFLRRSSKVSEGNYHISHPAKKTVSRHPARKYSKSRIPPKIESRDPAKKNKSRHPTTENPPIPPYRQPCQGLRWGMGNFQILDCVPYNLYNPYPGLSLPLRPGVSDRCTVFHLLVRAWPHTENLEITPSWSYFETPMNEHPLKTQHIYYFSMRTIHW